MPSFTTDNLVVSYSYSDSGAGSGIPVLLVHGWGCDASDWDAQVPALTPGHRVIVPDLRGHGRSSDPGEGFTLRTFAADLVALLDHLRVDRVIAAGHSMGATIVSALAAEYPERVAGIVVIDPPYGFGAADAAANLDFAGEITVANATLLASERLRGAEGPFTPADLIERHQRGVLATSPAALAGAVYDVHGSLDSVANLPHTETLIGARRVPVLALFTSEERAAWERGLFTSPASIALAFEGAGHWIHQERATEVNRALLEWISDLP